MREIERIDRICEKLRILWHMFPDQRFGQLISNYVFNRAQPFTMWFQEDDENEAAIDKLVYSNESE